MKTTLKMLESLPEKTIVLAAQQTTEIDLTGQGDVEGLGYLGKSGRRGVFFHPTLLLTPEKVPYGVIDHQIWMRGVGWSKQKRKNKNRSIAEEESRNWLASLEQTARFGETAPNLHLVNVGDRETGVLDCFRHAKRLGVDILVNASGGKRSNHTRNFVWEHMKKIPDTGVVTISTPRLPRKTRGRATLSIRFSEIVAPPSPERDDKERLEPVTLWAVRAHENSPPEKTAPLSWMLLTTIPVESIEEAIEKVHWRASKREIVEFFKTFKRGAHFNRQALFGRRFETVEDVKRYLTLKSDFAWRVHFLTTVSRDAPDMSCEVLLERNEWQGLYCDRNRTSYPPPDPLTLREASRMLAGMDGFPGRTGDRDPGPGAIWEGLEKLDRITEMWANARKLAEEVRKQTS